VANTPDAADRFPRWEVAECARSMLFLSCIKENRRSAGNGNRSESTSEHTPDWTIHRDIGTNGLLGSLGQQRNSLSILES